MKNKNYTIKELFDMLKDDESWESDAERRELLVNIYYGNFASLLY